MLHVWKTEGAGKQERREKHRDRLARRHTCTWPHLGPRQMKRIISAARWLQLSNYHNSPLGSLRSTHTHFLSDSCSYSSFYS